MYCRVQQAKGLIKHLTDFIKNRKFNGITNAKLKTLVENTQKTQYSLCVPFEEIRDFFDIFSG